MDKKLTPADVEEARLLREEAMALHEIEGMPFDEEDVALFEMFEREGWSTDRQRAYVLAQIEAARRAAE